MKTLRIKDICDKGSSNLKQKDVENQNGVYPVFGASGLIGKIDTYHQNKDYIAIVKDGSGIGRVTFMPAFSSVIGTLQYILPKEGFNIKYISYCLQSLDLAHYKQGAAIPHIYFRDYGEYEVNVEENPDDQQRIVSYLDAEFAKIEVLKANAEKQLQAAKDLFQAALDSFFCIKYNKPLEMLVNIINGFAFKSEDFKKEAELKVIKITNVGVGNFIEDDSRINKIYGNLDIAKVYKNDIVVALTRTIIAGGLKVAIVPLSYNEALLNQRVACLRENGTSSIRYIYYYLSSNSAIKYVQNKVNTLMQPNLSIVDLKAMPIPYLEMDKQNNIADRLDALSANVKALQTNYTETITLCNDLKQALLKKVFG